MSHLVVVMCFILVQIEISFEFNRYQIPLIIWLA